MSDWLLPPACLVFLHAHAPRVSVDRRRGWMDDDGRQQNTCDHSRIPLVPRSAVAFRSLGPILPALREQPVPEWRHLLVESGSLWRARLPEL
jgi:hypothetical protein